MSASTFILRLSCDNRPGIVAAISTTLFENGFNINDSQQFDDETTGCFFARVEFNSPQHHTRADVLAMLEPVMNKFDMKYSLQDRSVPLKVVIMVSKFEHCIDDLLYRWKIGDLNMDVVAVISNHPGDRYEHLEYFGSVPFHYLPVTKDTKAQQEAEVLKIVNDTKADLVVLARYMQILSDELSQQLSGKCINIHHSFLPGFKGAKPYHQAFERGVKIIGATAHYVTGDLDEGPIIGQGVEHINHKDTPESMVRKGRDIERLVLAKAVHYHLEGRVMLNGSKTVVFPE